MKTEITIRHGTLDDLPFLREMLFEAAYWRPDQVRPNLEQGLDRPDLIHLLADWGREGDQAVIAVTQDGQRVGAAWYRFWDAEQHSYGYISPNIPELAIAVQEKFRGMGIGHKLLSTLLKKAAIQNVKKVSLSVEIDNLALHLYRSHGFVPLEKLGDSWTMVAVTDRKN